MSLILRQIRIQSFRKVRSSLMVDGLADGLNLVIEPNETGKSTLVEALRAAFFVRHNTRASSAQSFAPYGEQIGPQIEVGFEVGNKAYTVNKRFLRAPRVELIGPQGRAQGEEAEVELQALLESGRVASRGGDIDSHGALGLLWVAQTEALSVTAPGQMVRDAIASTLELEVGSVMGSVAYRRVRERIDKEFGRYWTALGHKKGVLTDAEHRVERAEAAAAEAAARLASLEGNYLEAEQLRARLSTLRREADDPTDAEARRRLVVLLEIAGKVAESLATRRAEQEVTAGRLAILTDILQRHRDATVAAANAQDALDATRRRRAAASDQVAAAKSALEATARALDSARAELCDAQGLLATGERAYQQARRSAAVASAQRRHEALLALERRAEAAKKAASAAIDPELVAQLEGHDRAVAAAEAVVRAGATRITLSGQATGVTCNGEPMNPGSRVLTEEVLLRVGGTQLLISPPSAAASAADELAAARQKRAVTLEQVKVADVSAARACNEAARDAAAQLQSIDLQIAALTPADDALTLTSGAAALKLFVANLSEPAASAQHGAAVDMQSLSTAVAESRSKLAAADGRHDSALDAVRRAEREDGPMAASEAGSQSDLSHAIKALAAIEGRDDWATVDTDMSAARQAAAAVAVALDEARRDAMTHDALAIRRQISTIDERMAACNQQRTIIERDIARLEGTIANQGQQGLAGSAAAMREEAEAAAAACARLTDEAVVLKLLHDTLEAARSETSAKFVGPVAKRAMRYVERLLPDCELVFSESLELESVKRAGVDERCVSLSRGTQEQLSILTRIAFADMLREQGKPVSLILDDPLVYSDDVRLDIMTQILCEAATRMQVILLTCRERAFRHLPGKRLMMAGCPQRCV